MQNFVRYFGIAILGVVTSCTSVKKSEIISTDKDEYVENILNEADQNTLVVFDSDEVLITDKDALFHPNNSKICKQIISYLDNKIGKSARVSLLVERGKQHTMKLVNENFPRVIQNLQTKGVRVLLLTNYWAGKFYNVERIQDLRKAKLAHFNFDFKKSWLDCPNFIFHDLPKVIKDTTLYPTFDDGMIFTCTVDKGTVLEHFLKRIPVQFSRIIFIDDKMKNISPIFGVCQKLKIPCTCIEYTKVKIMKVRTVDFETEKKRFEDFTETNRWISDPEDQV